MTEFDSLASVLGVYRLHERRDIEPTFWDFSSGSQILIYLREDMIKAKEYDTGFTCQNFFPGNFHGLERVDRDLHRKLMHTEGQVYSR